MPSYDYQSEDGETIEVTFSIKEMRPENIIRNGKTFNKIISVPNIIIDAKKPKTLGALAAKNTEKMIKQGKIKKTKKNNPFWRPNKKRADVSLAKLSPENKKKYIMTGEK